MKNILIINGPNLNLVGTRSPTVYGSENWEHIQEKLNRPKCKITYFQSNIEGEIINQIQICEADGIVLNAGGYTHTSVAIRDAVEGTITPVVEVHFSNIAGRESFRHESLISPVAEGCIFGMGWKSYALAIHYLVDLIDQ